MASSRRIRPATASLVMGGSAWWPNSSRLESRNLSRSWPAYCRWNGTSASRISSARSTRAQAATAASAERRRFASSKLTRRFAVALTSRRCRNSFQLATLLSAPMSTSIALMASPSRMTTRCTPRTSRAFAETLSRPAAPTRAMAASFPGQVTSSAAERPGSVRLPAAKKAPRQTADNSSMLPVVRRLGRPRIGRRRASSSPVWRARVSPPSRTLTR